jgi:hypothetical protein
MPMLIGAFAKHFLILFPCPTRVVQFMGGIEMFYPGNINHGETENFGKGRR